MERNEPSGPPEIPKEGKPDKPIESVEPAEEAEAADAVETAEKPAEADETAPKLQLVQSTKSTLPETEAEEAADEPDELNELVENPGDPDGVHAAEEEQQWRDANPEEFVLPEKPNRKRRWLVVVLILFLVAAGAGGVYYFINHKANTPSAKQPASQNSSKQTAQAQSTATKHYDSVNYTLGFDYPVDWIVNDTTTKLTVTSPAVQLTSVDGTAHSAHVVVTIQNKQTTIPSYPTTTTAALVSDKLSYKQPTAVQRAQTYLTYLGYHKENGLDQLFITGDNGYQQGQQVPMSDIVKSNPLVGVNFQTCSTVDCNNGTATPTTLQASSWKSTNAAKQVTALLQSMQLN